MLEPQGLCASDGKEASHEMCAMSFGVRGFADVIGARRTITSITDEITMGEDELMGLAAAAIETTPWAFGVPLGHVVVLEGRQHHAFWELVCQALRESIDDDAAFDEAEARADAFAEGYGTLLVFEDEAALAQLVEEHPERADELPQWSQQSIGILQFSIWNLLEEQGVGTSLQHYGHLLGARVADTWGLPASWRLISQMPFGIFDRLPEDKLPIEAKRHLRLFK